MTIALRRWSMGSGVRVRELTRGRYFWMFQRYPDCRTYWLIRPLKRGPLGGMLTYWEELRRPTRLYSAGRSILRPAHRLLDLPNRRLILWPRDTRPVTWMAMCWRRCLAGGFARQRSRP